MKVVCGLGNPGAGYADTRHNVGWWVLDETREAFGFPAFRRDGPVRWSDGRVGTHDVLLIKPLTYMNRSGAALAPLIRREDFDVTGDLLVVVDDAALAVGRMRIRPGGSNGGHNGLRSVEASLRTREYARLRIGVGSQPPGEDLADWVLSPMPREEEDIVRARMPIAVDVVRVWIAEGVEAAARVAGSRAATSEEEPE
jgi:PTH1 family peptidyl-tRNA hydrolase